MNGNARPNDCRRGATIKRTAFNKGRKHHGKRSCANCLVKFLHSIEFLEGDALMGVEALDDKQ